MLTATRTETQYHDACADRADTERRAALACNELLSAQEAFVLACIMDTYGPTAPALIESIFEAHGWPADACDEAYLAGPGKVVWRAFVAYRAAAQRVAA